MSTAAWHAGTAARGSRRGRWWITLLIGVALVGAGLWAVGNAGLLDAGTGIVTVGPEVEGAPQAPPPAAEPAEPAEPDVPESDVPEPEEVEPPPAEDEDAADPEPADEPVEEPATPDVEPEPEDVVDVAEVQRQLAELGLFVGAVDGVQGQQTTAAVMAFQRVNEIQVDGVIGPQTLATLQRPVAPHVGDGPATRVDVDLTRQLLHVIEDGRRVATLHVSSGNGQAYRTSSGSTAYGNTPIGTFTVERRISGERHADLGILYDPLYFYRGWAIHGSNSVPAFPASHGCVRITRADAVWLFHRVPNGTPVVVHGGRHVFVPSGR